MNLADKERLRHSMAQACVIAMICLSITAPAIVISPSLPYFKIEQLLIPIVLAVYIWLLFAGIARTVRLNGMFLVGLLYFICNIISITYGGSVLGHTVDIRDYYELPKLWLPVAFFTITYEAELSECALRRLLAWFSFAAFLVCFYAWAQFIDLGFTHKLNSYYSTGGHVDVALRYAGRVYATIGNANTLGALMTWCVVLFVLAALTCSGRRLEFSLAAFACLVTLVMTGSRAGLLILSIGLVLVLASRSLSALGGLPKLALALFLIPLVVWTYLAVAGSNSRTLQRYQTLRNPLQIDSLRQRLDDLWPVAWADFSKSPLVGHGPGKTFLWIGVPDKGYIDSEYLNVLRERGSLGLLVFLGYYLYPLYLIRKGQRVARFLAGHSLERSPATLVVLRASYIMGVLALIMDIGGGTFQTPFLQGFLWLWLGIGARSAATVRELAQPSDSSLAEGARLRPLRGSTT